MRARRQRYSGIAILLTALVLLALALRLYRIDAQSFWNDEGTSIALAARGLGEITRGAANDIHPPLYYYLLHFWIRAFGNSELAARSLSALPAAVVIALTFAIGRRAGGDGAGLIAALLATFSPFQVYYAQEARMYMLSAFLGAASAYAFLLLLGRWLGGDEGAPTKAVPWQGWAVGYGAITALLLYTHYFAISLLVAENLLFALWWLRDFWYGRSGARSGARWAVATRWIVLQLLVVASYVPWLMLSRRQLTAWPAISEPLQVVTWTVDLLRNFSLGVASPAGFSWPLLAFGAVFLAGLVGAPASRQQSTQARPDCDSARLAHWCAILFTLVPIGILYLVSLRRPMYNPKFLLLCTPFFCVVLAQGIVRLASLLPAQRWIRSLALVVLAGVLIGCSLGALRAYYFDPRYARDDYRSIARFIEASAQPGDAILINAPSQIETFDYYYQGHVPVVPLPQQRPLNEATTLADLEQLVDGRRRIYAVFWATDESDPQRFIEGWLDQHTFKATDSWYGNIRLATYAVPQGDAPQSMQQVLAVRLGDEIRLLGYNLASEQVVPGDILQVTLFWQASSTIQQRYKVFTHVLDARGYLVAQHDAEPGGGAKITTIWQPQEVITDHYGLPILAGTPPGDYAIEIGLYGLDNGQRLPVATDGQPAGDYVILQNVRVNRAPATPSLSVLEMRETFNARFGGLTLLGATWTKLGYEHDPNAPIRAGDVLHLVLFWRCEQPPSSEAEIVLQLLDGQSRTQAEFRAQPTGGLYPLTNWQANEIVRDQHHWPLPANLAAGSYRLMLQVRESAGASMLGQPVPLTRLVIGD